VKHERFTPPFTAASLAAMLRCRATVSLAA
jgi:hypothetical protein